MNKYICPVKKKYCKYMVKSLENYKAAIEKITETGENLVFPNGPDYEYCEQTCKHREKMKQMYIEYAKYR